MKAFSRKQISLLILFVILRHRVNISFQWRGKKTVPNPYAFPTV